MWRSVANNALLLGIKAGRSRQISLMSLGDSTISSDAALVVVVGKQEAIVVPPILHTDAGCMQYCWMGPKALRINMFKRKWRLYRPF